MNEPSGSTNARFENYPLLRALIERRSRRFAPGMKFEAGPLSFQSKREPQPQSLGLMPAALGVGGFPRFAAHPFIWQRLPIANTSTNTMGRFPVNGGIIRTSLAYQTH